LEIEECIGKVRGRGTGIVRDSSLGNRRYPSFSVSGIDKEYSTPTRIISVLHNKFSSYARERTDDYVEEIQDESLIEVEGLRYTAGERMVEEIKVTDPIVHKEELEVENVVPA
jgi:hypothetical protein